MSSATKYLLDANVFIEAHRRYYAFDLCPGFWESLIWHHKQNRIYSIDRVQQELKDSGDDLYKWATTKLPSDCFASTNAADVINWFGQMQTWAQGQTQFFDEAKAEFAAKADCWLVAYAKANAFILVTHEEFAPEAKKKIPIPNVCRAFSVDYLNTFEMLKALQVKFTWEN